MYKTPIAMVKDDYRHALTAARAELQTLRALRGETDLRIAKLERTIAGLATLCGVEDNELAQGLTEACRSVLKMGDSVRSFRPVEMRDELVAMGYDLAKYSNPLAVIHTTLKRLATQGEATIVARAGNETGYRWTLNDPAALDALRSTEGRATVLRFLDELEKKRA